VPSTDDDLGFPEEELEALFASALADQGPSKPNGTSQPKRAKGTPKQPPPIEEDLFDLSDLEAELDSAFDVMPALGDETGEFEALDRELASILAEGDDDDEEDLDASLRKLFGETSEEIEAVGAGETQSLGSAQIGALTGELDSLATGDLDSLGMELPGIGEADGADSFPGLGTSEIDDLLADLEDEEIRPSRREVLAVGDDGPIALDDPRDSELARLRSRIHDLEGKARHHGMEVRTKTDRIEALEQQVVVATRQAAASRREFENFRRRTDREKDDLKKFGAEKVLKEFLVVFDNLHRALAHAGADAAGPLAEGVRMTLGQFSNALRRCGVEEVASAPGDVFDPQWHEAVGQEFSDSIAEGRICQSMLTGFTLNERLLRAAMVTVSRGPEGGDEEPATEPATEEPATEAGAEDSVDATASAEVEGEGDAAGGAAEDGAAASPDEANEESEAPPPAEDTEGPAKPKKKRSRKRGKKSDEE